MKTAKKTSSEGRKQPNIRIHIDDVEKSQVPVLKIYTDKDLIALNLPTYCPDFRSIPKIL